MRYELYCYNKDKSSNVFVFLYECEDILLLFEYIETYNLDNKSKFIIIDNEPTAFNLSNLGFDYIPTKEELKQRIEELKFYYYSKDCNISDEFMLNVRSYLKEYEEKARADTEILIEKLYKYIPQIKN